MQVFRKEAGLLSVKDGKICVVDPGSDGMIVEYEVTKGDYLCASYVGRDKDWGTRVWISEIVLNDSEALKLAEWEKNWLRSAAGVPVDAGLAGYFINKPSFKKEEHWLGFCDYTYKKKNHANGIYDTCLVNDSDLFKEKEEQKWSGFWTGTGIGDGYYPIYTLLDKKGKIIGVRINYY